MTVWEVLATILVAFVILAWSTWQGFVMLTRSKELRERAALNRRKLEEGLKIQERQDKLLGATLEGTGRIPGDAEEAVAEARAHRRAQGR